MARPRTELSAKFHELCDNVYFQPPTGTKILYPCIVYELENADVRYADNAPYVLYDKYFIKYITRDPDDLVRNQLLYYPRCAPEKMYMSDNLYHYPYSIYW